MMSALTLHRLKRKCSATVDNVTLLFGLRLPIQLRRKQWGSNHQLPKSELLTRLTANGYRRLNLREMWIARLASQTTSN